MNSLWDGKWTPRAEGGRGREGGRWDDDEEERGHRHSWFGRRSSRLGAHWAYGIELSHHARNDHPRLKVDPENEDPEDQSSETRTEVAKRYVANAASISVLATTFIQILLGGFAQGLIIGFVTTILPNVLLVAVPDAQLLLLQGFVFFIAFLGAPRAAIHYSVDVLLLMLRIQLPLLTSDVKMDLRWDRKHRWYDLWVMAWTTVPMIVADLGGWVAAMTLIGYMNGAYGDIGNPDLNFDGLGPYDTYQIMGIVGASYAFLYYTFGSYWIVSSNGHIKHIIDILKEDEMPADHQVFNYALFRSVLCVVNMAVTQGSPVIFEQLVAGAIINSSIHNIGYWFAAILAGFYTAYLALFFDHHIFRHYIRAAMHVRSRHIAFLKT